MEPFIYIENTKVPYFSLRPWELVFPVLTAGFSACWPERNEHFFNYALHVKDSEENVLKNRQQLLSYLNFPHNAWTSAEQVHGVNIQLVGKDKMGKGRDSKSAAIPATDGLITLEPGVFLAAFFADCVPLYFYSPDINMIGIAHAGWRGSVAGIASKMVEQFLLQGGCVKNLQVAIGPSIAKCCYEVDKPVISAVADVINDHDTVLTMTSINHARLDLQLLNRKILLKAGVPDTHIVQSKLCTSCSPYFYSFRRENGKTGRMVGWIALSGNQLVGDNSGL